MGKLVLEQAVMLLNVTVTRSTICAAEYYRRELELWRGLKWLWNLRRCKIQCRGALHHSAKAGASNGLTQYYAGGLTSDTWEPEQEAMPQHH